MKYVSRGGCEAFTPNEITCLSFFAYWNLDFHINIQADKAAHWRRRQFS